MTVEKGVAFEVRMIEASICGGEEEVSGRRRV